jgi:hypothetical protein
MNGLRTAEIANGHHIQACLSFGNLMGRRNDTEGWVGHFSRCLQINMENVRSHRNPVTPRKDAWNPELTRNTHKRSAFMNIS